jgi:hypothetical protein
MATVPSRRRSLVCALYRALGLDIFDLNYQFSTERLRPLEILGPNDLPRPGCLYRIGSFLKQVVKYTRKLKNRANHGVPNGSVLFFVTSKNQRDCVLPVLRQVRGACFIGHDVEVTSEFPIGFAYLAAIPFLPLVIFQFWFATPYHKRAFRHFFDEYWLIYGYYLVAFWWLRRLRPTALVVANDHNYQNRIFSRVAREQNVFTFYLQHASVTDKFPPLSFDYALLEGMDALSKYIRAGETRTTIFLVGMPKADQFLGHVSSRDKIEAIGICTNNLDDISDVECLCEQVAMEFPDLRRVLRAHPIDMITRGDEWRSVARRHGMEVSDSRAEISFSFLEKVDAIVAGDSNILLEAALMNVAPVYYDFGGKGLDWYGFVAKGLAPRCSSPAQVCARFRELLGSKPSVRPSTKWYCHTVDTAYEGRSGVLAGRIIQNCVCGDAKYADSWRRLDLPVEAYELDTSSPESEHIRIVPKFAEG